MTNSGINTVSFQTIRNSLMSGSPKKIAVAVAQDSEVISAIVEAKKLGLAEAILVGDEALIRAIAEKDGCDISGIEIQNEPDDDKAVKKAVNLVSRKDADVLMKGLIPTAKLLKAVLNKEWGLGTGKTLSHVSLIQAPALGKMLIVTDSGMVMYPDLKTKVDLINNAVSVAHAVGIDIPKVACIAAVEMVNPNMPATLDAAMLSKMNERGQITGCVVDGPLALDNAISLEAAAHKKISSPVVGVADILLMPNIEAGNVLFKASHYIGNAKMAGLIVGASAPIVLTSRADDAEAKVNSLAVALKASS